MCESESIENCAKAALPKIVKRRKKSCRISTLILPILDLHCNNALMILLNHSKLQPIVFQLIKKLSLIEKQSKRESERLAQFGAFDDVI